MITEASFDEMVGVLAQKLAKATAHLPAAEVERVLRGFGNGEIRLWADGRTYVVFVREVPLTTFTLDELHARETA